MSGWIAEIDVETLSSSLSLILELNKLECFQLQYFRHSLIVYGTEPTYVKCTLILSGIYIGITLLEFFYLKDKNVLNEMALF